MTREERELSTIYLEGIKEKYIEGEGYERHPLPEWYALDIAIKALKQEPKVGHWKKYKSMIYCSECGVSIEAGYLNDMNYCHNCGSYNGGENNNEE